MRAAVRGEWIKARRAFPPIVVSVALTLVAPLIAVVLLTGAGRGNAVIDAQLGPYVTGDRWTDLCAIVGVITAAGGLLGAGVLLSWIFGREFADGMIPRFFASPTPRREVAAAKLLLFGLWAGGIVVMLTAATLAVGLILGYGHSNPVRWEAVAKLASATALTLLLATPCAWVATITRGLLAPIGTAVALIVLAQFSVFTGLGAWLPFAAPGLWVGLAHGTGVAQVSPLQLLLVLPTALLFTVLTVRAWSRLKV